MQKNLFRSFWQGGFESSCHINKQKQRLDMVCITQHDVQINTDYKILKDLGISTVREGINWVLIEKEPNKYDFSSLEKTIKSSQENGIEVIWNLFHYGFPIFLDIFSEEFVDEFANYAEVVVKFIKDNYKGTVFIAPVNEISFLAFAAGEIAFFYPYKRKQGAILKKQLIKSAVKAMERISNIIPDVRFVHIDPLINVVPRTKPPYYTKKALGYTEVQFEAWDMIAGRKNPELGGKEKYLDIIGVNFYYSNQWEYPEKRLDWEAKPRDPRWKPLHVMLNKVYERYKRPLFLAETSHFGKGRGKWILEIADEIKKAIEIGVPMEGICIYPILDRPDWEDMNHWHNSGLIDVVKEKDGVLRRVVNQDYLKDLKKAMQTIKN